jgi:hypothetical protein
MSRRGECVLPAGVEAVTGQPGRTCRHLPISAVASWTGWAWRTVKDMDRSQVRYPRFPDTDGDVGNYVIGGGK